MTRAMRCAGQTLAASTSGRWTRVVPARAGAGRRVVATRAEKDASRDPFSSLDDGRVNRFTERESGDRRRERAYVGFWQTFAARVSEARRKQFDGRKTVDSKSKREEDT